MSCYRSCIICLISRQKEHPVRIAYLSDMATCSNMADPVLVFQLPDIDVLLSNNTTAGMIQCFKMGSYDIDVENKYCGCNLLHVGLVIVTDFLDSDVILGIDKRFRCGICLCQSHNTSNVLEIVLIVHFDLYIEF